ncbi:NUDIX domain-containing protein [Patescibacteria group bacterium]|nr:NUDIX domain-containing protein [Patescibacteria group bacterium]
MEKIQQVSIKGLLCRDNKVLLLKTTKRKRWEFPGGRMNFGENVEQTFKREVEEELGFKKMEMGKLINTWSFTNIRENINYHFIVFDFEFFTDKSKIKLSDEHTEYKWIGKDDFEEKNMHEGHKESLRKYFYKLQK